MIKGLLSTSSRGIRCVLALFIGLAVMFAILAVVTLRRHGEFSGSFPWVIWLDSGEGIDSDTAQFAICWNVHDAQAALNENSPKYLYYDPGSYEEDGCRVVWIRYDGSMDWNGDIQSYQQPSHLVVRYASSADNTSWRYQCVEIPDGRIHRETRIFLR
jgi:hypothetical protein